MKNSAVGVIFSSVPTDNEIKKLESDTGMPIKKIDKKDRVIILIGKGLFKKKVIIQKNQVQ